MLTKFQLTIFNTWAKNIQLIRHYLINYYKWNSWGHVNDKHLFLEHVRTTKICWKNNKLGCLLINAPTSVWLSPTIKGGLIKRWHLRKKFLVPTHVEIHVDNLQGPAPRKRCPMTVQTATFAKNLPDYITGPQLRNLCHGTSTQSSTTTTRFNGLFQQLTTLQRPPGAKL